MTALVRPEPVIVAAEVAAGHDGAAELLVSLRHPNGVIEHLVMDGQHGLDLMLRCGTASPEDLAGRSWREILGET